MKNILCVLEKRVARFEFADVAYFHDELRIALVLIEVLQPSSSEVIDDMDSITLLKQQIDHVASDKARPAGNHRDAHRSCSFFTARTLT